MWNLAATFRESNLGKLWRYRDSRARKVNATTGKHVKLRYTGTGEHQHGVDVGRRSRRLPAANLVGLASARSEQRIRTLDLCKGPHQVLSYPTIDVENCKPTSPDFGNRSQATTATI